MASNADLLKDVVNSLYGHSTLSKLQKPDDSGVDPRFKFKSWSAPNYPWPELIQVTKLGHGARIEECIRVTARVARILEGNCDGAAVYITAVVPTDATADDIINKLITSFNEQLKLEGEIISASSHTYKQAT